ncbi:hypothetical protein IF1G_08096 [Cordyceps javanica]|uniref:Uncharacterized protein n=1 Tax=Cordyceps javanica TaxID=43265 RepID=A0A545UVN4_9HYPO|nr:hypothetical protein IF1G_08096 [Cordyceps javanica]
MLSSSIHPWPKTASNARQCDATPCRPTMTTYILDTEYSVTCTSLEKGKKKKLTSKPHSPNLVVAPGFLPTPTSASCKPRRHQQAIPSSSSSAAEPARATVGPSPWPPPKNKQEERGREREAPRHGA